MGSPAFLYPLTPTLSPEGRGWRVESSCRAIALRKYMHVIARAKPVAIDEVVASPKGVATSSINDEIASLRSQ